ncbi:MAG: YraN family protein [Spirochaetaceae bacterium]|jgi:putative endonuclease|nr:YraN family protein [Spirochaetaceae bacterium]
MHSATKGQKGEERAARALEAKGMRIITRNFRSRTGEIDLVVLDGDTIVFVEVKAWSSYGYGDLNYGIDKKKQLRVIETAKYFLAVHREYNCMAVRFDVVFAGPRDLTHIAAAFMECV